ncbi:NYN domain-containing protein [Streptomyces sp. NPDC056105]|uniref:NYN domain-containing protein n=1 Tax=Streptomyces sp. NPDC056105 TaxID=3345714 RepID=UPI0035DE667C
MSDRVVVFYDYQNTYMGARRLYHERWDDWSCGQFDPVALARHLAADSPYARHLHQVRIYRGQPDASKQSGAYGASRRQHAAWERDPLVRLTTRPLRYPPGYPNCSDKPQEKGIDVQLTLDFAIMAMKGEFDVGIMVSTDTDLKPALEYVYDLTGGRNSPRAEVAAWSVNGQHCRRLALSGARRVYCHWIGEDTYKAVQDKTDYTIST